MGDKKVRLKERGLEDVRHFVHFAPSQDVIDQILEDTATIEKLKIGRFTANELVGDIHAAMRDEFAKAALNSLAAAVVADAALISSLEKMNKNDCIDLAERAQIVLARTCYSIADAMMKERNNSL